jgi:serine/threonine protein kinase
VSTLLKSFGAFDEPVLRQYTRQCYEGIAYIHSHAVMHRDIKGANILVAANGSLKIADFGASAQLRGTVTEQNDTASLRGTPFWMAPEVIRQERYGRSADCWSMGMTVIEMATANHREFPRSSCIDPFSAAIEMLRWSPPRPCVHFTPHDLTHLFRLPPKCVFSAWSKATNKFSLMYEIASTDHLPDIPATLSAECQDFILQSINRNVEARMSADQALLHPFIAGVVTRRRQEY